MEQVKSESMRQKIINAYRLAIIKDERVCEEICKYSLKGLLPGIAFLKEGRMLRTHTMPINSTSSKRL